MIKISVIVPIYNTPKSLLERCIESIAVNLKQFPDAEVLLIDDGSTDPYVVDLLYAAAEADDRFQVIRKENGGVSSARNKGIDMAKGKYVSFVDHDDYLNPEALSYMYQSAEQTQCELTLFGFCINDELSEYEEVKTVLSGEDKVDAGISLIHYLHDRWLKMHCQLATPWAKLYRLDALLNSSVRFEDDAIPHEDGLFNICFLQHIERIAIDNHTVYHYVVYSSSQSRIDAQRIVEAEQNIVGHLEDFALRFYPGDKRVENAIACRVYEFVKCHRDFYFTDPNNGKGFYELKAEMNKFLHHPAIARWLNRLRLRDAKDWSDWKNRFLLKAGLYWIFLLTQRNKRKIRRLLSR